MTRHLGDFDASTVVYGKFTTFRPSTGAAFALAGTPALSVYKDNSTTQSTSGITLSADFDGVTGLNHYTIDTSSDGTFYAAGSFFDIVITTGTVDSVSVVGAVVGSFTLRKNSALKPTTAARTLDVSAGGEAGVDWANVGSPTTTLALTGTTIATTQKVDVETIKTNPVVNGGTITFPTGATLASTTNITAGTITTASAVTTVNGLAANVITAASMAADASAEIADAVWDEDATGHQTTGTFGQAIGDPGANTETLYKAIITDPAGTNIAADIIAVKAETASILADTDVIGTPAGASIAADLAAIEAQTDDIGAAGAGLTAIPWNSAWDAEVQSEVDDALVAQNLDHLVKSAVDTNFATTVHADSVIGQIADNGAGFDRTTDSLEAIRDNIGTAGAGLTAIDLPDQTMNITGNLSGTVGSVTGNVGGTINGLTAAALKDFFDTDSTTTYGSAVAGSVVKEIADNAGGASLTVQDIVDGVWDEPTAGHATAGTTGKALTDAGSAGDPWGTALPGAYSAGTAGKIVGDNLNATVSSRLASASISLSGGAVTVGTNNDKTGYGLSAAAVQAIWDALTSALTTVGSIGKLLVDNINATISSRLASASYTAPLDAAGTRSAVGLASANLDTQLDALPTATENADALLNRDMSAVSDTTARSPLNALRALRNKWSNSSGTYVVFKEDDTTSAWTSQLDSDSTAEPVVGSDPA